MDEGHLLYLGFPTAFLFGLMGSIHCAGMCGPLVGLYANQIKGEPRWLNLRQHFLHNLGRLLVYTNLGILLGTLGYLTRLLPWSGAILGALIGIFIVAVGLSFVGLGPATRLLGPALHRLTERLLIGWAWYKHLARSPGIAFLGGLHGLLPCPLLYVALSSAVATQSPQHGGLLLLGFGLGTIPMMWGMGTLVQRLKAPQKLSLQRLYGVVSMAWGGILLYHSLHALEIF